MDFIPTPRHVLAGACLALALLLHIVRTLRKPIAKVPGPWYSKWTSLVLRYHWFFGTRGQYVQHLHDRYGPVVRVGPDEADICDLKAYRDIYTIRETFIKSPWYKALTGNATLTMFNTNDASTHRRFRRLLTSPLAESSLVQHHDFIDSKARLAILKMRQAMKAKGAADLYKIWMHMTTDVIGELTFGESFKMLEQDERNHYSTTVEGVARTGAVYTTLYPLHTLVPYLPIELFKRTRQATLDMLSYAEQSLARHRCLVEEDPDHVKPTLFTKLFKAKEAGDLTLTEIRDNAVSYIVAGSDTTAVTLTFLVWAVLQHPEIKQELLAELNSLPNEVTESQLREAPLLSWTIDETLRLYGAAQSGLPRIVPPGGQELAGHWFGGGETVAAQAYSMHRNAAIFHDPDKFDPRRWENPTKEMKDAFVPFGGGARVCIGLHLARMELRLGAFHFFRAFPQAKVADLTDDMSLETYFVLAPKAHRFLVKSC